MNAATKMISENAIGQWSCMGFDEDDYRVDAADVRNYFAQQLEDCSECYDEDWFALIGVPAIEATIDWEAIAAAINKMLDEEKEWSCDGCSETIQEKDGQVTDDDEALFLCHACFKNHTKAEEE